MVTEVLNSLIGNQLAAAVLSIAKDNGLDISAESYSVGPALHFSGRDAPTYDILINSFPSDPRKCVEMLLDHMFPKREVKLDDLSELENFDNDVKNVINEILVKNDVVEENKKVSTKQTVNKK
mgnify:CR=1 FL=1